MLKRTLQMRCALQVDTFLHTYTIKSMDNAWSGERDVALNLTEWKLLQPRDTAFTDQQLFLDTYECEPAASSAQAATAHIFVRRVWGLRRMVHPLKARVLMGIMRCAGRECASATSGATHGRFSARRTLRSWTTSFASSTASRR